jgi:hypothetical protein
MLTLWLERTRRLVSKFWPHGETTIPNSGPVVVTPGVGGGNVDPPAFHNYAREFLDAARSLERTDRYSPVPYYLYCHSIELALKAYLLRTGFPITNEHNRKKYGHRIDRLLSLASERGLDRHAPIADVERHLIQGLAGFYATKGFEYFDLDRGLHVWRELPSLDLVDAIAGRLVNELRKVCLAG